MFFLADPASFDVTYSINELTDTRVPVDGRRARQQWERLRAHLATDGLAGVIPATGAATLPDLVFVSNSALLFRDGEGRKTAVLSRYAHPERQGEVGLVGDWLRRNGWRTVELPEGALFEGAGDSRWSHGGQHLWIGYGAGRTTLRGIAAVREALRAAGRSDIQVHGLRLVSGRAYHLDLALCPFGSGSGSGSGVPKALWSPWAFAPEARETLRRHFDLVGVPRRYFWACNSVFLPSGDLLVPRDPTPGYRAWLREATGLTVVEVNVSEFQKAGGGVSCMVLAIIH
jgi:N-dimethylarginine dimethylaminohydrolase